MKRRSVWILLVIVVLLGAIALGVYLSTASFDTTLEFSLRDAVSKGWVWDATMTVQDRVIRGFYQSDAGPIAYRFTGLRPGAAELSITAPAYGPVKVPVTLKRGRNLLPQPFDLRGLAIPDLDHFIVFEEPQGSDLVVEIRPVGSNGQAVLNHPCLDIWVGARVSTQMKNGLYVQEETDEGSVRGEELFRGRLAWTWDGAPETVFRYGARIPGARIKASAAPLRVVDYLILVPQGEVKSDDLDALMKRAWDFRDEKELAAFLDREGRDRFRWFIPPASWNVKGAAQ